MRKNPQFNGHTLIVTSDKDGSDSGLERSCQTPRLLFHSRFGQRILQPERIAKAPQLKLAITAGIGSDHVDFLQAAIDRKLTVAEVTFCNSISVSEHVVNDESSGFGQKLTFRPINGW